MPLRAVSLCSGIGGFDLGLVQSGLVEVVLAAENAALPHDLYARRFPGVVLHNAVEDLPALAHRRELSATVVFGGWPCQPHSRAGQRRGDDDERELWPAVRDVIAAWSPALFIGENVPQIAGTRGHGYFERLVRDLHRLDYAVEWAHVPAQVFGAPHRRDRVFLVARRDGRWSLGFRPPGAAGERGELRGVASVRTVGATSRGATVR